MLDFKNIKTDVVIGVIILLSLIGSFLVGRFTVPAKVVTVTKEVQVEKVVEKIVYKESDTKNIDVADKTKVHTEKVVTKKPDGSVVETTTTDVNKDVATKEVEIRYVDREKLVDRIVEKTVEVTKTVDAGKPNWGVSVLVGYDFRRIAVSPTAPWINPLIVGVKVDRRIIGPFELGLWVTTTVSPPSPADEVAGGISIGARF